MQFLATLSLGRDQIGGDQNVQMLGDALTGHVQMGTELAQAAAIMGVQEIQQGPAAGISQRLEQQVYLGMLNHFNSASISLPIDMQYNTCLSRARFRPHANMNRIILAAGRIVPAGTYGNLAGKSLIVDRMISDLLETCAVDSVPVLLVRYSAPPEADEIFPPFRALVTKTPKLLNYAQIWDIRGWSGMKFDGQWLGQIRWNQDFRKAHGMEDENLLPFVLLMDSDPRLTKLIAQSAGFQIAPMYIGFNSESAWAIVSPETEMPQAARDFLAQNDRLAADPA